ncbi:Isotrichodermin C-15 hydroxylase [Cyphellophora attinorum]|uniref:Isotrichodermin C-15 hydroxylase n=1 Tax=Cyphellophora attinorum TaxID=1664694 RepID=A0A0N1HUP1_9EURO|nr:Isotrichodermin C-15 hydroxylase [Phialophora attinorum]KPI40732.1 Isotrichodermin C-15 hydroxylase [Phialophora attinorum]
MLSSLAEICFLQSTRIETGTDQYGIPLHFSQRYNTGQVNLSVRKAICSLLAAAVTYVIFRCIYNLHFHPLARYPGPWLARVSRLYAAYYNWRGDPHLQIHKLHEQYGPYVRWVPNTLLMNTPGALHDLYRVTDKTKKHSGYSLLASIPNTISTHDEAIHRLRRKFISKSLSQQAVREHEPTIIEAVHRLLACISRSTRIPTSQSSLSGWTLPFNMADWLDFTMLDVMCKVAFGLEFNTVENAATQETIRSLIEDIKTTQVRSIVLSYLPVLQTLNFDRLLFTKECLAGLRFVAFVNNIVKARLAPNSSETLCSDILGGLMTTPDPLTNKKRTRGSLISESAMLIIAGADTSATTLSALLFYLARNPNAYRKLATELRTVFPDTTCVSLGTSLSSCAYLRACIDETLRMTPPVGSILPREILPGGAVVDGIFLPEGTSVGTGVYAIQHHAA